MNNCTNKHNVTRDKETSKALPTFMLSQNVDLLHTSSKSLYRNLNSVSGADHTSPSIAVHQKRRCARVSE